MIRYIISKEIFERILEVLEGQTEEYDWKGEPHTPDPDVINLIYKLKEIKRGQE